MSGVGTLAALLLFVVRRSNVLTATFVETAVERRAQGRPVEGAQVEKTE